MRDIRDPKNKDEIDRAMKRVWVCAGIFLISSYSLIIFMNFSDIDGLSMPPNLSRFPDNVFWLLGGLTLLSGIAGIICALMVPDEAS